MKNSKKYLLMLCVLASVFALSSCGSKKKDKAPFQYEESTLISYIEKDADTLKDADKKDIDSFIEENENNKDNLNYVEQFKSWQNAVDESGEFVEFIKDDSGDTKYSLSEDKDSVTVNLKAKFEKRDVQITYIFKQEDNSIKASSVVYDPVYSLGEKMKKAALNTLMGLGVVALVLTFLSIFISLFKYVNKIEKALTSFNNMIHGKRNNNVDKTVEQIVKKEENDIAKDLSDDLELVAVITAAISEMEQKSSDGFVVRSIKRVPAGKWKKA